MMIASLKPSPSANVGMWFGPGSLWSLASCWCLKTCGSACGSANSIGQGWIRWCCCQSRPLEVRSFPSSITIGCCSCMWTTIGTWLTLVDVFKLSSPLRRSILIPGMDQNWVPVKMDGHTQLRKGSLLVSLVYLSGMGLHPGLLSVFTENMWGFGFWHPKCIGTSQGAPGVLLRTRSLATRWYPSSLPNLVNITPIIRTIYGRYIS